MTNKKKQRISPKQLNQDSETLYAMARIYCRAHHKGCERGSHGLCQQCQDVVEYSIVRTEKCPYQHKGTCKNCDIHCYAEEKQAAIREIMRYAGPRMAYRHPVMTFRYARKKLAERQ